MAGRWWFQFQLPTSSVLERSKEKDKSKGFSVYVPSEMDAVWWLLTMTMTPVIVSCLCDQMQAERLQPSPGPPLLPSKQFLGDMALQKYSSWLEMSSLHESEFFFPSWTCSGRWSFSTIALYIQSIYFCRCVLNAVCIFTWITFLNKTGCRLQTCLSSVDTHHQKQRQNFS